MADIIGDLHSQMGDAESSMIDLLKVAGVLPPKHREKVRRRLQPTLIEAYGKMIAAFTNKARRDITVKGCYMWAFPH